LAASGMHGSISHMKLRQRLSQRRAHEVLDFEHDGQRYTAGLGRFDDGRLAEVFLNVPGRAGSAIEAIARDAATVALIALQYGAPVDVIRRALTRNTDGSASGSLGAVLDLLSESE
jgi:hypothetical protein